MTTPVTISTSEAVMRPGFLSHPKFRRLCHILHEPVPHVLGYLECLWSVGYETSSPVIGDQCDVELACQWPGENGRLFEALLECRLIDEIGEGRYQIHDLAENAPRYVKNRLYMRQTRDEKRKSDAAKGAPPPVPAPAKKAKDKEPVLIPPELDCHGFRDAMEAWFRHRKQINKPISDDSIRLAYGRMKKWGKERAILAIEYSIAQGWPGIYEERTNGPHERSGSGVGSVSRIGTDADKIRAVEAKTIRSGNPLPGKPAQAPVSPESAKEHRPDRHDAAGGTPLFDNG